MWHPPQGISTCAVAVAANATVTAAQAPLISGKRHLVWLPVM
jgi:hypothetical protein